jgi:DNA/RNA endonuclease YhcR with UshA esterase domain
MKKNRLGYVLILILVAILAYYFGTMRNRVQLVKPGPFNASQFQSPSQKPVQVYDYTDAGNHLGEYAGVKGRILKVYQSRKGTIFFDYCEDYRNCPFSVVLFASNTGGVENPFQYEGKTITVTGLIKSYQGRAEIVLNSQSQITE